MNKLVLRELAIRASLLKSHQEKFTTLREVVFLREDRPGLLFSKDSAPAEDLSAGSVECVLLYEYLEHDLLGLIKKKVRFSAAQTKYILSKSLAAVEVLHEEHLEHQFLKGTRRFTKPPRFSSTAKASSKSKAGSTPN